MTRSIRQATRNDARSSTQSCQSAPRWLPLVAGACSAITDMASRRLVVEHRSAQYAFLRDALAGEGRRDTTVAHDQHAVGDMHELLHVAGMEKDRVTLRR